ncbi:MULTISPECIES: alpha/beta hydrolase family protein [Brevibacterium]|uniref:alpha/beta hydrolase family protein n=1 Tax=Brevibacterium TaxID=1696 RepID=UPI001BAB6C58|nr:prolyl oligopeptidase family serine peptidase [Brevibacterium sp. W7.2]
MNPEDLDSLAEYATPVAAGDETIIAITRPDLESNSYLSQLFAVGSDSPRRLTHAWRDTSPQLGESWAAYLSAEKGERSQLFAGPTLTTAHRITDRHLGVSEFALDDATGRILYVSRVPELGRYGTDDDIPADEEAPRRITSAAYQANGLGYVKDRPARAFLVDLSEPGLGKSGIAGSDEVPLSTMLTTPDSDVHDPQFSPDGAHMSVVAATHTDHGAPDLRSTVWLLGANGPTPLELPRMSVSLHRWIGADRILLVGSDLTRDELDFVGQMPGLFVHDMRTGATKRLTDPETVAVAQIPPLILAGTVVFAVDTDGATRLARLDLDAAIGDSGTEAALDDLVFLTDDVTVVTGFDVADGTAVVTAVTPTAPAALLRVDLEAARESSGGPASTVVLEHPAPAASVRPEVLRVEGPGGTVTGWLAKPAGQGPFPVILNIHGGPFAQYTHGWFDETQVLTSAGYAVVYANPRGSGGRTRTWGTAVQGDMAAPAMADVLAVLDHALAADADLDASRLGVQGGSYGGYLTAMTIAADHRFAAAIVERGYLDPHSFLGTSDIGRFFTEEYTSRDAAAIARQSPLAHANAVRTPTLVMHSELDFRCPLEQAQQYYAALQRAGVVTELLIFPGENHELSRSGQPRHRRQRFDAILDWWDQRLRAPKADCTTVDRPLTTSAVR